MSAPVITGPPGQEKLSNPFPGLRPFREDEEHLFFGRERQVDTLIDKLARTRFLAVVGTSGSGKSSLVNCGLQPGLHRGLMASAGPVWKVAKFRPGRYPITAMAQALAAAGVLRPGGEGETSTADVIETYLRLTNRGLVNVVEKSQLPARANLLVIADQFEEIFRFRRSVFGQRDQYSYSEDVTAFVNLLLAATECERIYVVLTMRSDFLGDCAQFHGLPESINRGQFLVPRMTRDERRQAIAGPIAVSGGELDPALLSRLVNDVGDNPDQLSILQHCINRMWSHWEALGVSRPISLDDYESEEVGTMAHALDRHAETVFKEVEKQGLDRVCEKTFKALTDRSTDPRGIRRPMEFGELCAIAEAKPEQMARMIDAFREPSRSFLMPPVPEELKPNTMIDISHESLMRVWDRLHRWVEEEAQSAARYRRLAESARLHAARQAGEWRNPELQLALSWVEWERPTPAWAELYGGDFSSAMAFLEKSKQKQVRELADAKFEQFWQSRGAPLGVVVAFILVALGFEKLATWIRNTVQSVASHDSIFLKLKGPEFLAMTLTASIFFGCYVAYQRYGKEALRRRMIGKLAEAVEEETVPAVQAEAAAAAPRVELPPIPSYYAAFGRRLMATLVDGLVFMAMFITLIILMVIFKIDTNNSRNLAWFYVALFICRFFYQVKTISSHSQATLGMKLFRVYVTDVYGNQLSWQRALVRDIAKLLSLYSCIGPFMPLWTKRRQTLHDKIAASVVRPKAGSTQVAAAATGRVS